MPRTWELSSLTTDCRILRNPRERRVSRWLRRLPMVLRVWVIRSDGRTVEFDCAMSRSLPGTRSQHAGRGYILQRQATPCGHLFRALQPLQRRHRGVHDVDRVITTQRLGQNVVHACTFQHRTYWASRDNPGTRRRRAEQHNACGSLAGDRMRDGTGDSRNPEKVLLGFLHTFLDRRRHLLGLSVTDPDHAVTVSHHDQRGKAEAPATFDDLGHPVDRDHTLEVRALLLLGRTAAPVAAVPTIAALASALPPALLLPNSTAELSKADRTALLLSSGAGVHLLSSEFQASPAGGVGQR